MFSKVKSLRLTLGFWSVMEVRFSLLSRNSERQDFLSFNALSIILLNFFSDLFLYLECFCLYVYHVCGSRVYHICVPLVHTMRVCVCCVYRVCVHVFVPCVLVPSGDQKRTEIQSFVNHFECRWWELRSRASGRAIRALNSWTV